MTEKDTCQAFNEEKEESCGKPADFYVYSRTNIVRIKADGSEVEISDSENNGDYPICRDCVKKKFGLSDEDLDGDGE